MAHKVLLIGGAGYVGRHLAFHLTDRGYDVCILDDLSTGSAEFLPPCELVVGDVAEIDREDFPVGWRQVDYVVHLAAYTDAGTSVLVPWQTFGLNVGGTYRALELAESLGANTFLFSSTAAVYGEPECIPINENHPLRPNNPYGQSKRVAEWVVEQKGRDSSIRTGVLRYFNVAGADPMRRTGDMRTQSGNVFGRLIEHIDSVDEKPFYVYGNDYDTRDGTPERDFIHVSDLAAAHDCMLRALCDGKDAHLILNAGYSSGVTVRELFSAICEVARDRFNGNWVVAARRPGDIGRSIADADRLIEHGWEPKYADVMQMLGDSLAWHDLMVGQMANTSSDRDSAGVNRG